MKSDNNKKKIKRLEDAKELVSRIMHKQYCEHDTEWITACFSPQFSWLGTGEEEYMAGREACISQFLKLKGAIPKCNIWGEEYDAINPIEDLYVVMGRMWIATDPSSEMYLKVHQRVSFVIQDTTEGLKCVHIHCSNPYQEMMDGEAFPDKIGRQSYEYVQERLGTLEEEIKQQNRQLEVIMSSIAGGLKVSNDDAAYSYAFVSKEAAALFGYTVEEFMEVTGGTAVGNVYPPDLAKALSDCEEAFRDGNLTYSTRYRVCCKDGTLKWILDSGKKAQDVNGKWMVNSLYLDITKSEADSQCLREQTQLLTSIYDTVPCGIIRFQRCTDGSYQLISLNKAALSIVGYEDMEDGIKDWHDGILGTVLKEDRQAVIEAFGSLKEMGEWQQREYRVRCKDGTVRWVEGTSMVVGTTAEGETVLQRTLVDITQRIALKKRLDREQDMYRVAMEASSAVMFEYFIDTDTFISYEPRPDQGVIRNELKNYSKVLREESMVHPDDVSTVIDNICKGRSEVFEVRCSTPEGGMGNFIWHRVNSRLMTENGRPIRVVGALHNIHSMKSKLSENSERLFMNQSALQAINGVYVSIFYVDLKEDTYYAVRFPEAVGEEPLSRTGSYSRDLCSYILKDVAGDDRKRVSSLCDRMWLIKELAGKNEHMEVEFRQHQLSMWLRMEIHLVASGDHESRKVIFAFRNISAEKQKELDYYEEEKRAKNALEEAYSSVNRANQAKSDFLSRMSHDIRTPMNAIMGMAAIASNSLGNQEKIADCLSKIRLSGEHLLELINEVLDMSKIESGNVSFSENEFSLKNILKEAEEIIKPDIERRRQTLTVEIKHMDHEAVYGDPVRVKQILLNLLSNAMKYTGEEGHIAISLEEKLSSESGVGCFEFVVQDDGIGMPAEFLQRMFSPFERAEDSRVSSIQGTGLGLAITHNLVQMMNGSIQVRSQLNEGTRFTVIIYLKLVQETETVPLQSPAGGFVSKTEFPPGTRVLLAEDNLLNQEIVVELLSMSGIETVCVGNGQEAVDRFLADPAGTYRFILMDIQMPVLDGYGASRAIRRLGETGQREDAGKIPIIALTANAFADDAYQAKQAGMNEHVSKPLDIDRLLEVMGSLSLSV